MNLGCFTDQFDSAAGRFADATKRMERWRSARPFLVVGACPYLRELVIEIIEALELELHVYRMIGEKDRAKITEILIGKYEAMLYWHPPPISPTNKAPLAGPLLIARRV